MKAVNSVVETVPYDSRQPCQNVQQEDNAEGIRDGSNEAEYHGAECTIITCT